MAEMEAWSCHGLFGSTRGDSFDIVLLEVDHVYLSDDMAGDANPCFVHKVCEHTSKDTTPAKHGILPGLLIPGSSHGLHITSAGFPHRDPFLASLSVHSIQVTLALPPYPFDLHSRPSLTMQNLDDAVIGAKHDPALAQPMDETHQNPALHKTEMPPVYECKPTVSSTYDSSREDAPTEEEIATLRHA